MMVTTCFYTSNIFQYTCTDNGNIKKFSTQLCLQLGIVNDISLEPNFEFELKKRIKYVT